MTASECLAQARTQKKRMAALPADFNAPAADAGLAFIGIAHKVLLTIELARHEAPLQAGGKTSTASAAQTGFFDARDDLILGPSGFALKAQNGSQGLVTPTGQVIGQSPISAIQAGVNLRVDVSPVKATLQALRLKLGQQLGELHVPASTLCKPSINWLSLSWPMKLHM